MPWIKEVEKKGQGLVVKEQIQIMKVQPPFELPFCQAGLSQGFADCVFLFYPTAARVWAVVCDCVN